MVKIRLARVGSKKNAIYRVVVADSRSPRDGRNIETIGRYNPQPNPSIVEIDLVKAERWLGEGAQPTPAVRKLIKIADGLRGRRAHGLTRGRGGDDRHAGARPGRPPRRGPGGERGGGRQRGASRCTSPRRTSAR